jgi:hypothetical protein
MNRNRSGLRPGTLIAAGATTATTRGTCAVCRYSIWPGQRIARLAIWREGWAHTGCTTTIVATQR